VSARWERASSPNRRLKSTTTSIRSRGLISRLISSGSRLDINYGAPTYQRGSNYRASLAPSRDAKTRNVPFALSPLPPPTRHPSLSLFPSVGVGGLSSFSGFQDLPRVKTLSSGVLPPGVHPPCSLSLSLPLPLPLSLPLTVLQALPPNWPQECTTKPPIVPIRPRASPLTRASRL